MNLKNICQDRWDALLNSFAPPIVEPIDEKVFYDHPVCNCKHDLDECKQNENQKQNI